MATNGFKNAAEAAIEDLYSDTSIPAKATLDMLKDLHANLSIKIASIEADLKRKA